MEEARMLSRRPLLIVCLVFFLSGSSALIFETVWFQIASRVLGSSVWSAAAVLMAFMAGLALGNFAMAAQGHRIRNGFKFYAHAELVIGATGVLVVWLLPVLSPWVSNYVSASGGDLGALNAVRFSIALVVLMIPASAMGTTLPLLHKLVHKQDGLFASSLGRLYGWNTLGALAGVLVAEFILIGVLGLTATALAACMLNLIAAFVVLKVFGTESTSIDAEAPLLKGRLSPASAALLISPFIAGLSLLALEVVWFRYLLLAHGGTSTTFSIMLATILCGIGVGGLIAPLLRVHASKNLGHYLTALPVLAAFTTLFSFYAYGLVFESFLAEITQSNFSFLAAALLLMFPTSVLSGVLFPLYGEALFRTNDALTLSSGTLTLVNTIGAALGSGLASFVLLPVLGIENSLIALAAAYLLIAFVWRLFNDARKVTPGSALAQVAAIAVFAFAASMVHGTVERNYRSFSAQLLPGWQLIKMQEGLNETLGYYKKELLGKAYVHRLITNNFSMSGTTTPARRYMKLYAYFPYLVQKNVQSVLQISYGVGNTAEAVTRLGTVRHFDIVDLSPEILELSHIIHDATGRYPMADPRSHVHVEDGRFFLQTTDRTYDLVTAEPPPPKNSGVVNLYSREYFEMIRERLNPKGMVTYWLPTHSLSDQDVLGIVRAFCDAFPDCSLWNGAGLDFMLVGTRSGIDPISDDELNAGWSSEIQQDLRDIGFATPPQLIATFLGDSDFLNELTRGVPPVTDNFPRRISPSLNGLSGISSLDAFLLDIPRREIAIESSPFLRSIFSNEVLAKARVELRQEGTLTALWASKYAAVTASREYLDEVFDALKDEDRKFLATELLNSSPAELQIIGDAPGGFDASGEVTDAYVKYLLLNRRFSEAGTVALERTLRLGQGSSEHMHAYQLYLLAMALDGRASAARVDLLPEGHGLLTWYRKRFLGAG